MGLRNALQFVRYFGVGPLLHWTVHQAQRRTGWLRRRTPARPWSEVRLADLLADGVPAEPAAYREHRRGHGGRFFFDPADLPDPAALPVPPDEAANRRTVEVADAFCEGRFLYYSHRFGDLGRPLRWLRNPFTGAELAAERHWSAGSNFSAAAGDIKDFWEPSRFAFAFWLLRAYRRTGDGKYPEAFWSLLESWMAANPPQTGPNWQSGQECALRAMAVCFGLYGFDGCQASTDDRVAAAVRLLAEHGRRIDAFIGHAVRQNTNHSLTEATGLLTLGLLLPELRSAGRWLRRGRRVLTGQLLRQVAADGSYVQQSTNYHRLMLQTCSWALALADRNGVDLGQKFRDALGRAAEFALQLMDPATGRLPNYGANDGALVLPLDGCEYLDHRPAVQLALAVASGRRPLGPGPWDEPVLWLAGPDALAAERLAVREPATSSFPAGGYYTLRAAAVAGPRGMAPEKVSDTLFPKRKTVSDTAMPRDPAAPPEAGSWCMVRCHSYRTRVGHVDPLHVDLWCGGINVLRDSGSFRYFAPDAPRMAEYFPSIRAHNTVEIDRASPLRKVSRFVWLPFPKARCLREPQPQGGEGSLLWQGEHYAYARRPWRCVHRREIGWTVQQGWRIVDTITGPGRHVLTLRWQLPDEPWELDAEGGRLTMALAAGRLRLSVTGSGPISLRVARGERGESGADGWQSLYYGEAAAAPVLIAEMESELPASFRTLVQFEGAAR